jgi:centrosomal CEP192-like protein
MLTVNGTPGTYVVARQQATLTAMANSGFSFYEFNNGPLWLPGGLSSNPKTFYVPETGLTVNPSVEFTNTPVYTLDVTPNYFSSNLGVLVDGGFWDVPKNFSSFYDGSGWNSGGMHTLQFSTPQGPFSVNTQFVFSTWTPGGTANPLSITLPATSQSYTATINPEFVPATNFNFPPCGGTAAITPASTITGGFYPIGTQLTYTETPSPNTGGSPWTFTGWTFDLTGTTNPNTLSPTDESLVYANFNTASAPLTITSLSPASVASGGSAFTLTINGTGFTQNGTGNPIENVGINFPSIFLTPTFVSSTELQVTVPAADIATPGTFLVFVENFPSAPWPGCAVFADQPLFVHQGTPSGATTVTATPTTLSFASTVVDQTSAGQTITVKNTGSTATSIAITASTNFGQTNSCPVAPATLAGGATCTITATFAPVTSGALTGNIAVTDSASNSPQLVTLSGTATAAPTTVTANPTSLAFGSQNVGTTSAVQTFTVQNTGTASTSIAIAASANYSQINNCGTLLQIGTSCTVTVSFTPTANGSLPGTISITDSAANSPQVVTLSGIGTSGGTVTVTVTPSSETFPAQTVGTTSAAKVVTVKNTGTLSTTISVGAATGDFAQTNTCTSPLPAGMSCTVGVKFAPTQVGTRTGTIAITDQASNSPQSISLTGTGKAAVIITVTPAAETFTAQVVGTPSPGKVITVKNTGSQSTPISIAASGDFGATPSTCGSTLGGGATCTITATFTPSITGSISGVITISDTASNSPQIVGLTGTGVAPVTFSAASLAFGSEPVNSTSTAKNVTMKNNLSSQLSGISIAASGNYSTAGTGNTCTSPLSPGATCIISVTFAPTANGSIDGAVTVTYTGVYSPQEIKLTGTGTGGPTPPLKFTPASLAFSSQGVGTISGGKTVTLKNTSASTVTFSSIVTSGNFTAVAGTTMPCSNTSTLIAGASCTLSVTFSPSIAGAIQGALVISYSGGGQQVVNLTGTAVLPVTIAPTSLTFASQAVGTPSTARTLTLTNNSGATLTSLSFTGSVDFSVTPGTTSPCGTSLAVGAKCTLSVTFTPSRTGSIQGAATITGSNNTLLVAKLSGTGG